LDEGIVSSLEPKPNNFRKPQPLLVVFRGAGGGGGGGSCR